ncbi:hypothetical protein SEUCBS139899_007207 [Sporothrix eucalyptigena]|uniref:Uncharacterized protein n=1 Tax=Sporothrix eucalyptigena TaxID=1812306 RepID=A0ABP0BRH9_9PEZI
MAPPSASRCCRAVRSRLASPSSSTSSTAAVSAPDGIWITDSALANAFDRYCRILSLPSSAGAARRFASNVPGPLESRRRLGKRQMTDQLSLQLSLNPAGSMLPPGWALPNAPDLRQWQWSPPRDSAEWAQNLSLLSQQADTAKTTSSSTSIFPSFGMPKWLTELGNEAAEMAEVIEPQQQRTQTITTKALHAKLQAWREAAGTLSEADFATQLDDVCGEFQTQIRLAALAVDKVRDVFGQVWAVLRERDSDNMEAHALVLYAAVLEGIRTCPLLQAQDFGTELWRQLFVCVSELLPNSNSNGNRSHLTAAMALDTLLATPPLFLADVVDLLPPHLCTIFASHAMTTAHTNTTMNTASTGTVGTATHTLAEKVAQVLQHMDLKRHGSFIDSTTELLIVASSPTALQTGSNGFTDTGISASNHAGTNLTNISPVWLLTLAHMPQVRQDALYKTMSQLQQPLSATQQPALETTAHADAATAMNNDIAWHMRRADLCELLLAQWISRGYVTQQAQRTFRRTMAAISAQNEKKCDLALAALALAVFWPKHSRSQCVALYVSLLRGLQTLSGDAATATSDLVSSVAVLLNHIQASPARLKMPPATFLESLAWAMDDVHAAVRLHELYGSTNTDVPTEQGVVAQSTLWSVGFWDKFASRLATALDEGVLTPGQVSNVLDLPARIAQATHSIKAARTAPPKSKSSYKPAKSLNAPTVALIEKLAVHFALNPDLAPRRALRGVEQCRQFLAVHSRTYPDEPSPARHGTGRPTSLTVLRALFHLITRDLEDALPGRTTRLRWFLGIVEREYSPAAALMSGRAIERWREAAKRIRQEEYKEIREALVKAEREGK